MQPGDLCFVSGVSGFLGSWIAKELMDGGFRVRGSVRSLGDADRVAALRNLLPGVEWVAADLRMEDGGRQALAGCQWVFHVASPQAVKSESDRTGGALSGTRFLLTAAAAAAEPTVQTVVVTSSEAAIAYGHRYARRPKRSSVARFDLKLVARAARESKDESGRATLPARVQRTRGRRARPEEMHITDSKHDGGHRFHRQASARERGRTSTDDPHPTMVGAKNVEPLRRGCRDEQPK